MKLSKLRTTVPVLVVAVAVVGAAVMVAARPEVETRPPEPLAPLVRVMTVTPEDVRLSVRAQGTVTPRTESDLVPEVSGRVVWVSPALAAGGFFEEGDPLLRVDRAEYEIAVKRAEAAVAGAKSQLDLARRNLTRSRQLAREGVVSATSHDDAQNAERLAASRLAEAEAALAQARYDLERTEITAPFAGRVRDESVDPGQFVARGTPVGRIYAVDYAEVRLPVPDDDVAFLDLELGYRGEERSAEGPAVDLSARFAGEEHRWQGRIVRTEGEIDPKSRMVHAVARVDDPYGRRAGDERPPLAVGMFVDAEIAGRSVPDAIVLPRAALRDGKRVLVVDGEDRLRIRDVEVMRAGRERVVLRAGLAAGERVCLSPLEAVVDGMKVRPIAQEASQETPEAAT